MPAYSYKAFDALGNEQSGRISADSERAARKQLKNLDLMPLEISETMRKVKGTVRVKTKTLVLITRQLATLLDSSIPLDESFSIVSNHCSDEKFAKILYSIREEVMQGRRLSDALKKYPSIFNNTYVSLVSAGDNSGKLDLMFSNLADYLEDSESVKQKVVSALVYPLILVAFSVLVIIALLMFVMPQVVDQFLRAGVELPLLTSILMTLSNQLPIILVICALGLALVNYLYKRLLKDEEKLKSAHRKILYIPIIGDFLLKAELERFSSTMHLLLSSGINLDQAMEESSLVMNNLHLRSIVIQSNRDLKEGKDFIGILEDSSIFPDMFLQLISSGFMAGNLSVMFEKVAIFMKSEIETKRSIVLSLLEPLVIIIMGAFILLVVLAILIPIMQMNTISIG
tara:strand:- start:3305 stop:4501 length:1197 start_codon:yes stop_codon:yes gene_type:complete